MNDLKLYTPGDLLEEDEYLLKFNKGSEVIPGTGFMTKFNQDGSIPKLFKDWKKDRNLEIYVIKEVFRTGWKLEGFRRGQSTDWVEVVHPYGFSLEVYCDWAFEKQLKTWDISKGLISGEFMWKNKRLIQKTN